MKKKKKKDNRKEQALSSKGSNIPQEPRPIESLKQFYIKQRQLF